MISERSKELLRKAAEALEKGMSPFEHWFLSKNEVTLDECMTMSERIATIIKWFLAQPKKVRAEVLLHDLGPLAKGMAAHLGYLEALQAADVAIEGALQEVDRVLEE